MNGTFQLLVLRRTAVVLLLAALASGCGGSSRSGASHAVEKCVSLWNAGARETPTKYPQLDARRLAFGGGAAALVVASDSGSCTVLLGKTASRPAATSGDLFIYVSSVKAYEATTSIAGASLPTSWNARPNDDGTLSIGGS